MSDSVLIISIIIAIIIFMTILFYYFIWSDQETKEKEKGWSLQALGIREYEEPN